MNVRRNIRKGFTLIEILIVVIILGILAAIVIPQFTSASTEARESNLRSQMQTLRSQVALYKLQHKDLAPTSWNQLTMYTDVNGGTSATKTGAFVYGPYYEIQAKNPLAESSTILVEAAATTPTVTAGTGWYLYNNGQVKAARDSTGALFVE